MNRDKDKADGIFFGFMGSEMDLRACIERIDHTRARMAKVRADRETAIRLHAETMAALDQRVVEIQFNCSHELTHRHQDPCGHDSYTECEICGANLGK